jgi:hypothetical protein
MKNTLPFLLLILCVLACGKFGARENANVGNSANVKPEPPKAVKVVDLPATIGKSKDEISKMINSTPAHEDPWLEYSLPEGDLTFQFDKGKAAKATFRFKAIRVGDASISGTDTAEQIATMTGVDIKGKTPKSEGALADTYEQDINGKKAEIRFYRTLGKFDSVMIDTY